MDYSNHSRLYPHKLKAGIVEGANVYGANGDYVGEISHFLGIGTSGQAIVEVGMFLGFSDTKLVTIPASSMGFFMCGENDEVHARTSLTKEEIHELAGKSQHTH